MIRDKLLAAPIGIELGLVRNLAEVEVEDVEPILLRRRPEPDVAAHAPGPRQSRVKYLERDVAGADEDLLGARLRPRQAQRLGLPTRRGTM